MEKTVFITGASSGLGKATAKLFQSKGWNVVATMRTPEAERELTELKNVFVTRLDVQDGESIRDAVRAGLSRFGTIDVLINNAGYGAYGPLEATPIEKVRRQFDVNILGTIAVTKELLPHLRAERDGTIVNVSSIGGRFAFPLGSLYHATKFAMEGFSEALQYELAPLGIRVKLIEPGGIRTDFGGRSLDFSNDPTIHEYQPIVEKVMGVLGPMMNQASTPEEIAEVVYTASTDKSDRLRFKAGKDAVKLLGKRREESDATFFSSMRAQFGLAK